MFLVFVSNVLNHHSRFLCEELIKKCDNFCFVSTDYFGDVGYQKPLNEKYVVNYNASNKQIVQKLIIEADAVIYGSCPNELISIRMELNKLSFLYTERFFKKGTWRRFIPQTKKKIYNRLLKYKNKRLYVLAASSYVKDELKKLRFPVEKCFKFGYFPETRYYEIADKVIDEKEKKSILWAARFIDWKHPELPILIAKQLVKDGYNFTLRMIGDGPKKSKIMKFAIKSGVQKNIRFLGSLSPNEVRDFMEKSEFFLFTSDQKEGWGAVLNESMNSCCVAIANIKAGSTQFLIDGKTNGLIYNDETPKKIANIIADLWKNERKRKQISLGAYNTIADDWNSKRAAERLVDVILLLKNDRNPINLYRDGILSEA